MQSYIPETQFHIFSEDELSDIELESIINNTYSRNSLLVEIIVKTYYYSDKKEIDSYRDGKKLIFQFDGENNSEVVKVPLVYYQGYQAYLKTDDGKKYDLKVEKDTLTGQVLVSGGKGLKGLVTVEYKMTFIQFICYTISTVALIGLVIYIIVYNRQHIKLLYKYIFNKYHNKNSYRQFHIHLVIFDHYST
mgnify:CR=1 FL=1